MSAAILIWNAAADFGGCRPGSLGRLPFAPVRDSGIAGNVMRNSFGSIFGNGIPIPGTAGMQWSIGWSNQEMESFIIHGSVMKRDYCARSMHGGIRPRIGVGKSHAGSGRDAIPG